MPRIVKGLLPPLPHCSPPIAPRRCRAGVGNFYPQCDLAISPAPCNHTLALLGAAPSNSCTTLPAWPTDAWVDDAASRKLAGNGRGRDRGAAGVRLHSPFVRLTPEHHELFGSGQANASDSRGVRLPAEWLRTYALQAGSLSAGPCFLSHPPYSAAWWQRAGRVSGCGSQPRVGPRASLRPEDSASGRRRGWQQRVFGKVQRYRGAANHPLRHAPTASHKGHLWHASCSEQPRAGISITLHQ